MTLLVFDPVEISFPLSFRILHISPLKCKPYPSSINWPTLRRLCFRPSTYYTSWMGVALLRIIEPWHVIWTPILYPNRTNPPSKSYRVLKLHLHPVIWCEQPLSKIHVVDFWVNRVVSTIKDFLVVFTCFQISLGLKFNLHWFA